MTMVGIRMAGGLGVAGRERRPGVGRSMVGKCGTGRRMTKVFMCEKLGTDHGRYTLLAVKGRFPLLW